MAHASMSPERRGAACGAAFRQGLGVIFDRNDRRAPLGCLQERAEAERNAATPGFAARRTGSYRHHVEGGGDVEVSRYRRLRAPATKFLSIKSVLT
jgi:hypothetical protein